MVVLEADEAGVAAVGAVVAGAAAGAATAAVVALHRCGAFWWAGAGVSSLTKSTARECSRLLRPFLSSRSA